MPLLGAHSRTVAAYGSSEAEVEQTIRDATAAGYSPRYVSVTTTAHRYLFPATAIVFHTRNALVVDAYHRVYAWPMKLATLQYSGDSGPTSLNEIPFGRDVRISRAVRREIQMAKAGKPGKNPSHYCLDCAELYQFPRRRRNTPSPTVGSDETAWQKRDTYASWSDPAVPDVDVSSTMPPRFAEAISSRMRVMDDYYYNGCEEDCDHYGSGNYGSGGGGGSGGYGSGGYGDDPVSDLSIITVVTVPCDDCATGYYYSSYYGSGSSGGGGGGAPAAPALEPGCSTATDTAGDIYGQLLKNDPNVFNAPNPDNASSPNGQEAWSWMYQNNSTGAIEYTEPQISNLVQVGGNDQINIGPPPDEEGYTYVGIVHTHPFDPDNPTQVEYGGTQFSQPDEEYAEEFDAPIYVGELDTTLAGEPASDAEPRSYEWNPSTNTQTSDGEIKSGGGC